ncbi:hypothetical protein B0T26DRAFT_684451 [Lasiosphaeria miniovina]|uniref:Uncharacterized protein n=1 Tax=Lasiosphaeria miniovina TaxID=1954250 RepID=A0AA40BFT3_9PEZI|nr:uncharacterized protein B0T26DRAFT_684451 [Lasiosphaeria miniovina]KAK0733449.1 hypothetical protein B0T26DRAFT_684451 [Lasiosphaeria miniovina]
MDARQGKIIAMIRLRIRGRDGVFFFFDTVQYSTFVIASEHGREADMRACMYRVSCYFNYYYFPSLLFWEGCGVTWNGTNYLAIDRSISIDIKERGETESTASVV